MKEQTHTPISLPPEDYLDYFDPEEDDYELLDMLYEDTGWYWFQSLQDIKDRKENEDAVVASTEAWQSLREAVNAHFVGTKKRKKPQTFNEVDRVSNWDNVAATRDIRHSSVVEDWQDEHDIPVQQEEYVDPFYDSSDDDFDWEDFKAGGTGIKETTRQNSGQRSATARPKRDVRDTRSFRDAERLMRNGPRSSATKTFIK